jgi:lactoylglutathione lyase
LQLGKLSQPTHLICIAFLSSVGLQYRAKEWKENFMLPIQGLYEIAIRVKDLDKAEPFYRNILGLQMGIRDESRRWLFLRAGDAGMVVLQEDKSDWPLQHFAFTTAETDIEKAARLLREQGIEVDGPHFHEWIPATSIYFTDPDGHDLELCAPAQKK